MNRNPAGLHVSFNDNGELITSFLQYISDGEKHFGAENKARSFLCISMLWWWKQRWNLEERNGKL